MLLELVSRSALFASPGHCMCEFGAVLQWRLFYAPGPDMGRVPVGPVVGSERPAFPGCGSAVLPRFLGATANGQHLLWPLVLRGFEHHAGRSGRLTSPHSAAAICAEDRKSTRLNSSHLVISYAVFCLKKKNDIT